MVIANFVTLEKPTIASAEWNYIFMCLKTLNEFWSEWNLADSQIDDSVVPTNRQRAPFCISTPSNLLKENVNPLDHLEADLYRTCGRYRSGERGETLFLHMMEKSKMGGILICNFDSKKILDRNVLEGKGENETRRFANAMPESLQRIVREGHN